MALNAKRISNSIARLDASWKRYQSSRARSALWEFAADVIEVAQSWGMVWSAATNV